MSASATLKDKLPLLIAGVVVIAAIVAYTRAGSTVSTGAQIVMPNNASTDAANAQIAASNAASQQSYQQLVGQEFGQMVGFGNNIQTNLTNVQLQNIQADVQKTQIAAQEQEAALQAQTMQTQYNDQLAAQQAADHTSQQNNLWNGIFSTIGAIFGL